MTPTHENGSRITYRSLGREQITATATPGFLQNLPADLSALRRVVIRNLKQPICWSDDGSAADPTTSFYQYADEIFVTDASFNQISLVRAADATADVDVRILYYG